MTFNEAIKLFKDRKEMCQVLGVTKQAVSIWSLRPNEPLPKARQWQIKWLMANDKKI